MSSAPSSISKNFRNILIVRTDRIGDVVLTTPAIKALRRRYPAARLSILVAPGTLALVEGNPYLDDILVDDRQGSHRGMFGFLRLVRMLAAGQFDLAVIFHTKRRYNLACFLAQIPVRLGYKDNKYGFLLTHPQKDTRPLGQKHEAQYCLDLLQVTGAESLQLDVFLPLQKDAEEWAIRWLAENGLKSKELIAIHPGASDKAKCWPAAGFAALMDRLAGQYPFKIVVLGSVQTVSISGEILRQTQRHSQFVDLTGKTNLAQTISLLRRARLLVSNDSGPVHLAAAAGTPVISLFMRDQPGINAGRWGPLGNKGFVLKGASITVDEVINLIDRILPRHNQYEIF